jgi:hypothetical protein
VVEGDAKGRLDWPWDRVPEPFRDWVEMKNKGKSHFKPVNARTDEVSPEALDQWQALRDMKNAPGNRPELELVLPVPYSTAQEEAGNCTHMEGCTLGQDLPDESTVESLVTTAEVAVERDGNLGLSSEMVDSSRKQDVRERSLPSAQAGMMQCETGEGKFEAQLARQTLPPQVVNETQTTPVTNEGHVPHGHLGPAGSSDGPGIFSRREGNQDPRMDIVLQYLRAFDNCLAQMEGKLPPTPHVP